MHFSTGRSAWHTTNFCFDFSNTVQHAHVQPLTLSTASSKVEVTHQMDSQAVSPHHTGCRQRLCLSRLRLCLAPDSASVSEPVSGPRLDTGFGLGPNSGKLGSTKLSRGDFSG